MREFQSHLAARLTLRPSDLPHTQSTSADGLQLRAAQPAPESSGSPGSDAAQEARSLGRIEQQESACGRPETQKDLVMPVLCALFVRPGNMSRFDS